MVRRTGGDHRRQVDTLLDAQARLAVARVHELDCSERRPVGSGAAVADSHESLWYLGPQIREGAGSDDPSRVEDDDVLADVLDQIELVAREQHGRAVGGDLGEQVGHGGDGERVETRERFVEDEQLGLVDQRGDQLHPLLVAVRQGVEPVPRPGRQAQPVEPHVDAALHRDSASTTEPTQVDELVADTHARIEATLLRHVPEPGALLRTDLGALPADRAAVQGDEAEHRPHGRCLPGAVRPKEAGEPARSRRKRAGVERDQRAEPLAGDIELEHHSPPACSMRSRRSPAVGTNGTISHHLRCPCLPPARRHDSTPPSFL